MQIHPKILTFFTLIEIFQKPSGSYSIGPFEGNVLRYTRD